MPYIIGKKGHKFVVRKRGGKTLGTHSSKKKALAQQAALYANEQLEPKDIALFMESAYLKLIGNAVAAVHATIWFNRQLPHLIFKPIGEVENDLAGRSLEVTVFFYGSQTKHLVDMVIDASMRGDDVMGEIQAIIDEGHDVTIAVNYEKSAVLIMPKIQLLSREDANAIVDELEEHGFKLGPMPFYGSVDHLVDIYTSALNSDDSDGSDAEDDSDDSGEFQTT